MSAKNNGRTVSIAIPNHSTMIKKELDSTLWFYSFKSRWNQ
jgi:hypothetical protein